MKFKQLKHLTRERRLMELNKIGLLEADSFQIDLTEFQTDFSIDNVQVEVETEEQEADSDKWDELLAVAEI